MASGGFGAVAEDHTLGDLVDRLVAKVQDRNLQALFAGFARINRQAAA